MDFKELRRIFNYREGELYYYNNPRGRGKPITTPAGTIGGDGYRSIRFKGTLYKAHRLIWAYFHNEIPHMLDHIDRNKLNNKIENLRPVTKQQNLQNSRGYGRSSKYKGVHRSKAGWTGRICISSDPIRVDITKTFPTENQAAIWYNEIAREWWGEYAYINIID